MKRRHKSYPTAAGADPGALARALLRPRKPQGEADGEERAESASQGKEREASVPVASARKKTTN